MRGAAVSLMLILVGSALAQTPVAVTGQGSSEEVLALGNPGTSSRVISFEQMPARTMANGGESRDALKGTLPSGEALAVHESVMGAGVPTNPVHAIDHAEVITVIEGTLEFLHDGKAGLVTRGGVIYVAKGTRHTMRNVGREPVRYVLVAIGGDAGK
jgi:quercetin dioxygenase-like cupin family protein